MRSWIPALVSLLALLAVLGTARAEPDQDAREIEQVCLDFAEGFFQADVARMQRAAHPNLVHRSLGGGASASGGLVTTTLPDVVTYSRIGHKASKQPTIKVDVLDVFAEGKIATAKITTEYVDYAHLAKIDGRWQIVSLLYARR